MSLKDDMDALGRALDRGPHHAKYWMYGDAARSMLTPEQFDEAVEAAERARQTHRPLPIDPTAGRIERNTYRFISARGD